jgi:hypothetical protein
VSERLPAGWVWDAEEGWWACHAYDPHGSAVTITPDGNMGKCGRVPEEVMAACRERAQRLWGVPRVLDASASARRRALVEGCRRAVEAWRKASKAGAQS